MNINFNKYKNINENFFQKVNSENIAYFCGFIFADGCLDKNSNRLSIQLQERDHEILDKLKDLLNVDCDLSIRFIKDRKYYGLQIHNKKIKQDLINIGITPDKTKDPKFPIIPYSMFWHFLRGLTDGDGTIYFKGSRCSWSLVCHSSIALLLKDKIEKETNIHVTIQNHWRTSYIKILSINGNLNCYKFLNLLYGDSKIYLNRKFKKYIQFIEFYKKFLTSIIKKKYIGIEKIKEGKYSASLKYKNKKFYLGVFDTQNLAAKAYDDKIDELKINRIKNSEIERFIIS